MGTRLLGLDPLLAEHVLQLLPGAEVITSHEQVVSGDVVIHHPRLDDTMESCREVWRILIDRDPRRYVQLSTLHLLDGHDPGWWVTERFASLPGGDRRLLTHHLAELTSREITRVRPIPTFVLRLADVVDHDPGWEQVHVHDAARAVVRAAVLEHGPEPMGRWGVLHISAGNGRYAVDLAGLEPFDYQPQHPCVEQRPRTRPPSIETHWKQPVRRPFPADDVVVLFGAGGAIGGPTSLALAEQSRVIQVDHLDPSEWHIPRQPGSGVPIATVLPAPHEQRVADVRSADQVLEACRGASSIAAMSVIRHDPVLAWEVNLGGLLNIMDAAHELGIQRVVACGPSQVLRSHPIGYHEDDLVPDEAPPRPGDDLYSLTQFLAQEAMRVLAEAWGMSCLVILFTGLASPYDPENTTVFHKRTEFMTYWEDAGSAVAAGIRVDELPTSCPTVEARAPGPHARRPRCGAERLLGWRHPTDMSPLWWHPDAT